MPQKKKIYATGFMKSVKNGVISGAVASTEAIDRDGDRILAEGWDLDNFIKQPRLLWSHDSRQLPIGKVTDIKVVDKELRFNAQFASKEANPFAVKVQKAMEEGLLNAFSVGFIPKEHNEKGDITKAELLEISVVNIPANAEAMMSRQYKSFQDEIHDVESIMDESHVDKKEADECTHLNQDSVKNAISAIKIAESALNNVVNKTNKTTQTGVKKTKAKETRAKSVSKEDTMLQALRIADRAIEHGIRLNKSNRK